MFRKLEEFLFGKIIGRVIARLIVSAAAYIVGQALAVGINLDQAEVSAALGMGANALYTLISDWRKKRATAAATPAPSQSGS